MFSRTETMKSTSACAIISHRLQTGIGHGGCGGDRGRFRAFHFRGFTYTGERFQKYFGDFIAKYGFRDMYSGGFYPFDSLEEHWAYWSRYIYINRYLDAPKPVYQELLKLVQGKDYLC